ncbi:MAG: flavodoxin-dependent (E)-4-hydroxy-3-methylbut-2-enyl-diphosphate synthase, partial [Pseudanabaena sp.]
MTTVSENRPSPQNGKVEPIIDGSENLGVIVRRKTRPVQVGNITIGGGAPVVVQSMINEDTLDIDGSVAAIRRLHEIGCEIVRVTVPSMAHAAALSEIRQQLKRTDLDVPLVADVPPHGLKSALAVAPHMP